MVTWKWLSGELAVADHLIERGGARRAMERLEYLLSQYDEGDPGFGLHRANILHQMGKAAAMLGDGKGAELFFTQAVSVVEKAPNISGHVQADFLLSLAEHFTNCDCHAEATFFAESALKCLAMKNSASIRDESAIVLKRYAGIAEKTGAISKAYLALSLGLLVIHELGGMESEVAAGLTDLVGRICKVDEGTPIHEVGKLLIQGLKENTAPSMLQ